MSKRRVPREVTHYLDALPPKQRETVTALHSMILDLYPEAMVDLQYKMPTYHLGENWLAVANQKHYVSFYTCGSHHIEAFKQKHPKVKTGKGCINLKPSDPLPKHDLQAVVRHVFEK